MQNMRPFLARLPCLSWASVLTFVTFAASSCGQQTFDFLPGTEGLSAGGSAGSSAQAGAGNIPDGVCRTAWNCGENDGCPPGARFCQRCADNSDCRAPLGICAIERGTCVECRTENDCVSGLHCDPVTLLCTLGCGSTSFCNGERRICDASRGSCVACNDDAQCRFGPKRQYCVSGECVQCYRSEQCPAEAPYCAGFDCHECRQDSHCNANMRCRTDIGECVN
jgi:hypothetical protein